MYEDSFKLLVEKPNEALEKIMERYGCQLKTRIELYIHRDEELVKDVINETLLCLWGKREQVAALDDPFVWMMAVARNIALYHARGEHESLKIPLEDMLHPSDSVQADTALRYRELYERFMQATELLTPKERDVVIDAKLHDMNNKELGEVHGISVQRVKNIVSSGMKKIRQMLKDI